MDLVSGISFHSKVKICSEASFRTSPWDVNENLPLDYARIFKFKRWSHAKIRAKKWRPELGETIAAGHKITIGKNFLKSWSNKIV